MLYSEFINKASNVIITEADNGSFYLEPMWTVILLENNLDPKDISDYKPDWQSLNDVFKLEVEKRNIINSKKNAVIDWLYDIITNEVTPIMLEEETDYLKNLIEYLRANHETQILKNEEWDKFKNS